MTWLLPLRASPILARDSGVTAEELQETADRLDGMSTLYHQAEEAEQEVAAGHVTVHGMEYAAWQCAGVLHTGNPMFDIREKPNAVENAFLVGAYFDRRQKQEATDLLEELAELERVDWSAAGIAALTKVLLQMRHGMLVRSLHTEALNPHIDFAQTPFTVQSITAMLAQMGVNLPPGTSLQLKNVAAVLVTAQLPPFAQPGQTLDVNVSSLGNAKSLRGGTLIATPLKGADGQIYALAQGNLLVGGAGASAGGSKVQINHLSAGRIPGGATVERVVANPLMAGAGSPTNRPPAAMAQKPLGRPGL